LESVAEKAVSDWFEGPLGARVLREEAALAPLALDDVFDRGLEGVPEADVRQRMSAIETHLAQLAKGTKLYAHVQNDVLKLKYYHQRYSNYLRWLTWTG